MTIITIDGPAGSGKSSVAAEVAQKLGYLYIDSGALYRAATWTCLQNNVDLDNADAVLAAVQNTDLSLELSDEIRTPEVTKNVKKIADNQAVRDILTEKQRALAAETSAVLDGRDSGTVVFPNAGYKFYLDASLEERAHRRLKDLERQGVATTLADLMEAIKERDHSDVERAFGGLRVPRGARVIDTTDLTQDEVVDVIVNSIKESEGRK